MRDSFQLGGDRVHAHRCTATFEHPHVADEVGVLVQRAAEVLAVDELGDWPADQRRFVVAEQHLCGGVGLTDFALHVDDEHRAGRGVEGGRCQIVAAAAVDYVAHAV